MAVPYDVSHADGFGENLLTASRLRASSIWPLAEQEEQAGSKLPHSFQFALIEYFDRNPRALLRLDITRHAMWKMITWFVLGAIGNFISASIPGGWIPNLGFRDLARQLTGVEFIDFLRIQSLEYALKLSLDVSQVQ